MYFIPRNSSFYSLTSLAKVLRLTVPGLRKALRGRLAFDPTQAPGIENISVSDVQDFLRNHGPLVNLMSPYDYLPRAKVARIPRDHYNTYEVAILLECDDSVLKTVTAQFGIDSVSINRCRAYPKAGILAYLDGAVSSSKTEIPLDDDLNTLLNKYAGVIDPNEVLKSAYRKAVEEYENSQSTKLLDEIIKSIPLLTDKDFTRLVKFLANGHNESLTS